MTSLTFTTSFVGTARRPLGSFTDDTEMTIALAGIFFRIQIEGKTQFSHAMVLMLLIVPKTTHISMQCHQKGEKL